MPAPEPGDDDVLVRVRACICGSDVHGYDGSTGRRIPPLVMGHEAAGVVERVGPDVRDFTADDRLTFDSTVSCGRCQHAVDRHRTKPDDAVVAIGAGMIRRVSLSF